MASDERRAEPRWLANGVPVCREECRAYDPHRFHPTCEIDLRDAFHGRACMPAVREMAADLVQLRAKMSRAASCPHKRVLDTCEHCDRVATRAGRG